MDLKTRTAFRNQPKMRGEFKNNQNVCAVYSSKKMISKSNYGPRCPKYKNCKAGLSLQGLESHHQTPRAACLDLPETHSWGFWVDNPGVLASIQSSQSGCLNQDLI